MHLPIPCLIISFYKSIYKDLAQLNLSRATTLHTSSHFQFTEGKREVVWNEPLTANTQTVWLQWTTKTSQNTHYPSPLMRNTLWKWALKACDVPLTRGQFTEVSNSLWTAIKGSPCLLSPARETGASTAAFHQRLKRITPQRRQRGAWRV